MKVVILSKTCSRKKYNEIFEERTRRFIDPSQKFFLMLIKGMATQNINILCISMLPISSKCHRQKIWKCVQETDENIQFLYPGFFNIGVFRIISSICTLGFQACKKVKKNDYVIYDPTDIVNSVVANFLKKVKKITIIPIITDIPSYATIIGHQKQKGMRSRLQKQYDVIADRLLKCGDAYILLTDQMNNIVNPHNKPYIVIEGSVDSCMNQIDCQNITKDYPKSVVYAGGIHEKFGVVKLAEAFAKADLKNYELKIYGAGQAVETIKEISKKNPNVRYMGVISVEDVVKQEIKASLLVNPRPTSEEFTKYSFPSKTLEYMVSGTPLLTTKLPGIPEEYFEYVYTFEDEDVNGMKKSLEKTLNDSELEIKGQNARKFVLDYKNNILQGKKILNFLKDIENM